MFTAIYVLASGGGMSALLFWARKYSLGMAGMTSC